MYQYGNDCGRMSSDLRFSMRKPGGANADKCRSRVGGQYVEVDDLWSFMASDGHDPCGWPFVECLPTCSLPSNPAVRGWAVKSDGYVYQSSSSTLKIGCVDGACSAPSLPMKDPKVANKIGAM